LWHQLDGGLAVAFDEQLATRIRKQYRGAQPYLLALTGYGQAADRARGSDAGFNGHLVKPVDLAVLLRVVADAHLPAAG